MAQRPPVIQLLERDKILCGHNFPTFVRTWNWLVEGFDGFCGDGDLNPQNGWITVDRANAAKPVIRFKDNGMLNVSPTWRTGRFAVLEINNGTESGSGAEATLKDCLYRVGGKTYECEETTVNCSNGIVALSVTANTATPSAELQLYASLSALQAAERDLTHYIVPLYKFEAGAVACDLRIGPDVAMGEF